MRVVSSFSSSSLLPLAAVLVALLLPGVAAAEEAPAELPPVPVDQDMLRDQDMHQQVQRELRSLRAGWYDPEEDSWRRVIPPRESDESRSRLVGGAGGFSGLFTWLLIALLLTLAVALGLALYLGGRLPPEPVPAAPRRRALDNEPAPEEAALMAPRFLDLDLDEVQRADLLAALEAALAAGDWLRAVICAFAARLVLLDRSGLLQLRPGATNRQLLQELWRNVEVCGDSGAALHKDLTAGVRVFEQVYFGGRRPSAELSQRMAQLQGFRDLLTDCRRQRRQRGPA